MLDLLVSYYILTHSPPWVSWVVLVSSLSIFGVGYLSGADGRKYDREKVKRDCIERKQKDIDFKEHWKIINASYRLFPEEAKGDIDVG